MEVEGDVVRLSHHAHLEEDDVEAAEDYGSLGDDVDLDHGSEESQQIFGIQRMIDTYLSLFRAWERMNTMLIAPKPSRHPQTFE